MENNNEQHNVKDKILNEIKEGKIKMKSKTYFMVRTVLFTLGITVLLLFLIYVASFIVFSLRISGIWFLPIFGFHGVRILFGSLPWLLILLAAILIIALEVFAERISFVYKRPTVYSLLAIIAIVLIIGLAIGFSPFHTRLFGNAREGGLPFIGQFYRGFGAPRFHNFHNGSVSEITTDGFPITTPNGETLRVIADDAMKAGLKGGDFVIVIGERTENTIRATVLREIDEDTNFFPAHRRERHLLPR